MSPRKSQKKFSAIPKTAKKPVEKTPVVATPIMAEVPKPAEIVPTAETAPVGIPPAVESVAAETVSAEAAPSRTVELVAALGDLDADTARDAAAGLGLLNDASAVAPLIASLSNIDGFTHPVVRAAAATSLGLLGDVRAVEPLIAAINDSMAEASSEAIRSLAILGDARAVPALIDVVRNASGFFVPTVRRAAVVALGQLGGPVAVAELRLVAADAWEDSVIRDAAADSAKGVSSIEGTQG